MKQRSDKEDARRAKQREADVLRLRGFEQKAVQDGIKLSPRDRLKAAFHLTRAWKDSNREGLRKEHFQEQILIQLQRPHKTRQEFRLTNWTLRRGENPTTQQDLTTKYKNSSTPQKALEPYLVGITVAAEHCGANPDDWKLDMMRDLSLWSRPEERPDVAPPDDRPAETLAILLNALCTELARRNRLGETFDAIRRMNCRWEMFSGRLVATEEVCMQRIESPISPVCEDTVYFEEMFPFPSVVLLRVPYVVGKATFILAPEKLLKPLDGEHLSGGDYFPVGLPFRLDGNAGLHYNIPDDAPGLEAAQGEFVWFREIRLCIVPDGRSGFTGALETRPHMEVRFDDGHAYSGRHHVDGGYEIDLERGLFYGRSEDGDHIFPKIHTQDGEEWRLKMQHLPDGGFQITEWTERDPETTGWYFDPDPVLHPGIVNNEPWYLSYTPAAPPYLRHWLTQDFRLAAERAVCPWDNRLVDRREPDSGTNRVLPPMHELNFPDFSHATWIECCLHNGLIEEALQTTIDSLTEQTALLQAHWHSARERHSNALLRRWKTDSKEKDIGNDSNL